MRRDCHSLHTPQWIHLHRLQCSVVPPPLSLDPPTWGPSSWPPRVTQAAPACQVQSSHLVQLCQGTGVLNTCACLKNCTEFHTAICNSYPPLQFSHLISIHTNQFYHTLGWPISRANLVQISISVNIVVLFINVCVDLIDGIMRK